MTTPAENTVLLWYDGGAEDAAGFYAKTFPEARKAPVAGARTNGACPGR